VGSDKRKFLTSCQLKMALSIGPSDTSLIQNQLIGQCSASPDGYGVFTGKRSGEGNRTMVITPTRAAAKSIFRNA
jgi:hypothetical protein